jgi:hypothetical protein
MGSQVTCALAFALSDLVVARDAVARVAEVCRAPTEPQRDRTAEFTLKVDELGAVFCAFLDASSHFFGSTLSADQLFLLVVSGFLLGLVAIFKPSEVRIFALKAQIKGTFKHSVAL